MEKFYLSKIANLKDIRNQYHTVMVAVTAGLASLFLSHSVTFKILIIAVLGIFTDLVFFIQYNYLNKLINKYMEKLK